MSERAEFTVADAYPYDRRGPVRWILSHVWRYRLHLAGTLLGYLFSACMFSLAPVLVGQAAAMLELPANPALQHQLLLLALGVLVCLVADGLANMLASFAATNISNGFAADARQELYASLLRSEERRVGK